MKMTFTQDAWVDGKLTFESGKTYEISEETGSVERWIRRGMALPAGEKVSEQLASPEEIKEVLEQIEQDMEVTIDVISGDDELLAEFEAPAEQAEDQETPKKRGRKSKTSTDLL